MAFRLFDAEARISLDDAAAKAGLKSFQKDFQETAAKIGRTRATAVVRADIDDVERKLKKGEALLRRWEHRRATAETDADTLNAETKIAALHESLDRLERERTVMHVSLDADARQVEPTLRRITRSLLGVKRQGDETRNIIQRMGDALHNVRVEAGPLSLSLRGLIVALATLAPIVTSVGGALGALAASISAAAVGAVGLGGALGTAFIANLGAVAAVVAPLSSDLRGLAAAQKLYDTAVREAGPDSERAANALEKLRAVQDQATDAANRQHKALQRLGDRWRRLTRDARPEFVELIDHALERVNARLPEFARHSTFAFTQAAKGARIFVDTFTGREATTNLGVMMDRLSFATPALARGFANLGVVVLRVFRSFSRFFTPVARGFRTWSDDLLIATGNTARLNQRVDSLVDATRTWGGVMFQVSRLILGFFRAAVPQGTEMGKSLEGTVKAWADWMDSKEGQSDTRKFLRDAISLTGRLFDFMIDIGDIWFKAATAARPFVEALVGIVGLLGQAVNKMIDLTGGADGVLQLIAAWVVIRKTLGWASELLTVFGGITKAVGALRAGGGVKAVLDIFGKRGTTPANPLFVSDVTGGGGGAPATIWKGLTKGGALRVFVAGGAVGIAGAALTYLALSSNKNLPTGSGSGRGTRAAPVERQARGTAGLRGDRLVTPREAFERQVGPSSLASGVSERALDQAAKLSNAAKTVTANMRLMARNSANSLSLLESRASATMRIIARDIGVNTAKGRDLAARNFKVAADAVGRAMSDGRASAKEGMAAIERLMRQHSQGGREVTARNMGSAAGAIAQAMTRGKGNAKTGMAAIERLLRSHSKGGADGVRTNMGVMATAISNTMRRAGRITDSGLKIVRRLMVEELKMYGLSEQQALASVDVRTGKTPGGFRRQDMNPGDFGQTGGLWDAAGNRLYAHGGMVQYGRPGQRGKDTIQTVIAGQPAMVAPGEVAAVFTGTQQRIVEAALAQMGIAGLPGLFQRERTPHARGYQLGGMANTAGLNPAISSVVGYAARKYGAVVTSGVRNDPGSFHHIGAAADLVSGNMLQMGLGLANVFGPRLAELIHTPMGFSIDNGQRVAPFAQAAHYSHVHAAALGRALAAAAAKIKALRVKGVDSPLLRIVQRNLDIARAAAQKKLDAMTASMMGGEIGMTGFTGPWTNVMAEIARQRGWSLADWQELIGRESSGIVSNQNPSSTAFGLGQLLSMHWANYGGGPGSGGVEQIVAMANYILDRYTTPTRALEFHDSHNWYQRGGSPKGKGKRGVVHRPRQRGFPERDEILPRGDRSIETPEQLEARGTKPWWSAAHLAPWRQVSTNRQAQVDWIANGERWADWQNRITVSESRAGTTKHARDDKAVRGYKLEGSQLRRTALQRRIGQLRRALGRMPSERKMERNIKDIENRLEKKHKRGPKKGKFVLQGDARDRAQARIKRIQERLGRRRGMTTELGERRTALTDIWSDISSIRQEIFAEEEAAEGAEGEPEAPVLTNEDIEMRAALAMLTPGLEDDIGVAQERVTWAENVLAMAQGSGQPADVITEAAENVAAAREQLAALAEEQARPGEEQRAATAEAVAAQALERERIAKEGERITAGALQAFQFSGDIGFTAGGGGGGPVYGVGGASAPSAAPSGTAAPALGGPLAGLGKKGLRGLAAGGGNLIQVINTLHPGDPQTLRAIGGAAASGFGYQGYVASPRAFLGV